MSNLSDIGFPVKSEQDVNQVIMDILNHLESIPCPPHGFYFRFADRSGAEIYLQTNSAQEILGFNPAFAGKSRRKVGLTKKIERDTSPLDGAFHGWAEPAENDFEASGAYPFVFDVPDFRTKENTDLTEIKEIGLTAFASSDFQVFGSGEDFDSGRGEGQKFASRSFIPSGLFSFDENGESVEITPPQAHGILTGEIKEFERRTNEFTGTGFYWFLIETFGGEADIVADIDLVRSEPKVGGIVRGSFWLSGKLIEEN
jgi:hypothetical protein